MSALKTVNSSQITWSAQLTKPNFFSILSVFIVCSISDWSVPIDHLNIFYWFSLLKLWYMSSCIRMCLESWTENVVQDRILLVIWTAWEQQTSIRMALEMKSLSRRMEKTTLVGQRLLEEKVKVCCCWRHRSENAGIGSDLEVCNCFNPFTPTSDQDRISPYSVNTISSRQVMRIEKNINHGTISWSNTKFSELTS